MEVPPLPASGARPYNNPNPGLFKFFDIPGAKNAISPPGYPACAPASNSWRSRMSRWWW